MSKEKFSPHPKGEPWHCEDCGCNCEDKNRKYYFSRDAHITSGDDEIENLYYKLITLPKKKKKLSSGAQICDMCYKNYYKLKKRIVNKEDKKTLDDKILHDTNDQIIESDLEFSEKELLNGKSLFF